MEKVKVSLSSIKKVQSACQYARDFETELEKQDETLGSVKNSKYDQAIIIKDSVKLVMSGEAEISEIEDLVESATSADDETTKTSQMKAHNIATKLQRYLKYEHREPHFGKRKTFENEYNCLDYAPDVYFEDSNVIELCVFKSGKPVAKNTLDPLPEYDVVKDVDPDAGEIEKQIPHVVTTAEYKKKMAVADMYYMLQYGKTLVPDGESRTIRASMVYMTAPKEKADSLNLIFNPDDQVLSVEIMYSNTPAARDLKEDFERDYEHLINDVYETGFETCSSDDCSGCLRQALCEYKPAPPLQEKKEVTERKKIAPSKAQAEVIGAEEGIFRVNAGAGSGKTECITERFATLVRKGTHLDKILCITFTDAAAREMRDRIAGKLMGDGIYISKDDIECMTFNTFAYRIVKDFYEDVGFAKLPNVIDEVRQSRIITNLLESKDIPGLNYREFSMNNKYVKGALACSVKEFDIIKSERLDPDADDVCDSIKTELQTSGYYRFMSDQSINELVSLYKEYKEQLKEDGLITFADQEPMGLVIIDKHAELLEDMGYEHIMIDETQDTSVFQLEFIKRLIATKSFVSLMCVGDDSQAIYSFRGTTPENMIHLSEKLGKPVTDLFLVENYRCVPEIVSLANMVNGLNTEKIDKDLITVRSSNGKKPVIRGFHNEKDEYGWIGKEIKVLIDSGVVPEDIAFIAFTKNELMKMSKVLSELDIPWVMKNPMNLMENSRVHAALSLCKAFYQPEATKLYFDYLVALYDGQMPEMEDVFSEIKKMKNTFQNMENYTYAYQLARLHAYLNLLGKDDEVYQYFLGLLNQCEDLPTELAYASDFMLFGEKCAKKMDQDYKGVVLTTAHSSKGLEWKYVFNSITKYDSEELHGNRTKRRTQRIEEVRRLLFVSITRARDELYLTGQYVAYGPKTDQTYNQFLRELYDLTGMTYDPKDPMDAIKEKARKEKAKARRKALAESKKSSKSREMTSEEKKAYNRMTAGSYQQTMFV